MPKPILTRRRGRFGVLDNMCQFNICYTDKLYNKSSTSYAWAYVSGEAMEATRKLWLWGEAYSKPCNSGDYGFSTRVSHINLLAHNQLRSIEEESCQYCTRTAHTHTIIHYTQSSQAINWFCIKLRRERWLFLFPQPWQCTALFPLPIPSAKKERHIGSAVWTSPES